SYRTAGPAGRSAGLFAAPIRMPSLWGEDRMKVLVVDDNAPHRELLEVLLWGHGYDVTLADNGAEALEKALQDCFDLIISDVMMPQIFGAQRTLHKPFESWELLAAVREGCRSHTK